MRYAPLCYCTLTLRCPRGDGKSAFEILIHPWHLRVRVIPHGGGVGSAGKPRTREALDESLPLVSLDAKWRHQRMVGTP